MLGVTTEKTEGGVEIQDITKESAAEKAGLKENDIITKIDDTKIEDPDDLSAAIKKHKPGDKVTVTYLRNGKEQKTTAELTKWKGVGAFGMTAPGGDYKFEMPDLDFEQIMPKLKAMPRVMTPNGQNWNWNWSGGSPKLGLSVQDTDNGKGVKVIEVDDESNAEKAGIKEDDIITEVDGKTVNGADEIAKVIRESKDKVSVMIKLERGGKTQNIEVKMPRKLKTADL
jgi:serine protease Do